jgi:hypothetical protein
MSVGTTRRMALGIVLGAAFTAGTAAAQADELAGIPDVGRLTEQEQATYRRRLRDASGDQERAQIREEARIHAQSRVRPQQGSGQGSGGGQGGGGGQTPRRIPGSGGGRSN